MVSFHSLYENILNEYLLLTQFPFKFRFLAKYVFRTFFFFQMNLFKLVKQIVKRATSNVRYLNLLDTLTLLLL